MDAKVDFVRERNAKYLERLESVPGRYGGQVCVRNTRIRAVDIIGWLSANMTRQEIVEDFPQLLDEDITAALVWAYTQLDPDYDRDNATDHLD